MRLSTPFRALLDVALPPRCPGCGIVTEDDHRFCEKCWATLRFIAPPWCAGCRLPFPHDFGAGAMCGTCLADAPRHAGIHAAVAYGDVARHVALRLKYAGRIGLAETMARQMVRVMPAGADLLLPVPLHRWRLWSRGFNQAALMAASLSRATGVAHDPLLLRRTRATPPLRGLGRAARRRAVRGVFALDPKRAGLVRGKAIVLVDDIHTSGATSNACIDVLLRAGATSVAVLCWARVLEDDADVHVIAEGPWAE